MKGFIDDAVEAGAVAGSHMVTLVSRCQLAVQTYSGRSSHKKLSQTKFEPNQTDTNGFNRFWFWFQKFWLKQTAWFLVWEKWPKPNQTKLPQHYNHLGVNLRLLRQQ